MFSKVQELVENKIGKDGLVKSISEEFCISKAEVHKRIRSMFGVSVEELLTPAKQELSRAILQADNVQELKSILKKQNGLTTLYDKYYGVSTFAAARKVCEEYREITAYNPTKADNLSILISQALGDVHLEYNGEEPRYSICIQHSENQFEYLVEKVKLLNKAYPTTPSLGKIKKFKHSQGHSYFSYRTNKMSNSDIKFVYETSLSGLVKEMTPLGLFLLYMDDGCLVQNQNSTNLRICNKYPEVRNEIQKYLLSYGVKSNVYHDSMVVCISDTVNISKFLNNFVKPFKQYTPENMEYKTTLKI